MFDKYPDTVRRRIFILLSNTIDNNVKNGVVQPDLISEYFIKEVDTKDLASWSSLKEYTNQTYFYENVLKYVEQNIDKYIKRYDSSIGTNLNVSQDQLDYLVFLVKKTVNHKEYNVRVKSVNVLKELLGSLPRAKASYSINEFKNILKLLQDRKTP